jgi:hypothetical protein
MIQDPITRWLKYKNKHIKPDIPMFIKTPKKIIQITKEDVPDIPDIPDNDFQIIIQIWVDIFWNIAKETDIVGPYKKPPPEVNVAYSVKNKSAAGIYYTKEHTILINTFGWFTDEYTGNINNYNMDVPTNTRKKLLDQFLTFNPEIFLTLASTDVSQQNTIWHDFFGFYFPSSTIIHELEHARRNTGHSSAHDSIYTTLFPGDTEQQRTFEQSANAIYEKVLSGGFAARFMDAYKKTITVNMNLPERFRKNITVPKELPKKLPQKTTKSPTKILVQSPKTSTNLVKKPRKRKTKKTVAK